MVFEWRDVLDFSKRIPAVPNSDGLKIIVHLPCTASLAPGLAVGIGALVGSTVIDASTTVSVGSHPIRVLSIASASAWSTVSLYSSRTSMVRTTYQHWFRSGEPLGYALVRFLVSGAGTWSVSRA